ncbi:hypothetical protein ASPFODRAFT_404122 [Aspergillus luchuensis CBS 106.47]|uniref:Uncharacterized protein n=1 Tax=Aspergillus luchuensis (strain CBS 106.47) TaxID=1137211 RepID=A0A1M3T1P8_ASPLC|nr:hypothetical protein ASPFODRAFT_404122 [Aspergillus luchuensis CBS 106.47]
MVREGLSVFHYCGSQPAASAEAAWKTPKEEAEEGRMANEASRPGSGRAVCSPPPGLIRYNLWFNHRLPSPFPPLFPPPRTLECPSIYQLFVFTASTSKQRVLRLFIVNHSRYPVIPTYRQVSNHGSGRTGHCQDDCCKGAALVCQ